LLDAPKAEPTCRVCGEPRHFEDHQAGTLGPFHDYEPDEPDHG
jgi:hypothetical protein